MRNRLIGLSLVAIMVLGGRVVASAQTLGGACYAPGTDVPLSSDYNYQGNKWGNPAVGTPGGLVTYSFASGAGYAYNETSFGGNSGTIVDLTPFMPAGYKTQIAAAFNAWSSIANIQFVEVPDNGLPLGNAGGTGMIRIGGHVFDGVNGTLAHGYFPGSGAGGDIHFDIAETWKIGFGGGGFDVFQVAAHEIGHAIGLDHTSVANSLMNPFYTESFTGLQADDIAGAKFIYGAAPVNGVPEPGTFALLGLGGALGIALAKRRRA